MRLPQGCVTAKRTRLQCYMDDPHFLLRRKKTARDKNPLSPHRDREHHHSRAQAGKGPYLEWIAALFRLKVSEGATLMTINEKIAKETLACSRSS